ncbi:MAG: cytochrome c3 family protein [Verrucomicrobiota bacterium]
MRRLNMPPQIVRLVLLTIGIVAAYLVARYILTPSSFGQYGFYRGNALEEVAARSPVYAGKKSCDECHSEELQLLAKFEHKTLSCEACHGVGQAHVENPDVKFTKLTDNQCLRCHEASPSRPKWLRQITFKEHYKGQRCTDCHVPHQPNEVP